MNGALIFFGLAVATALGLWTLGRVRGREAVLVLSALFTAAAGYTWQGRPGLRGAPASAEHAGLRTDSLYMVERSRLASVYGETAQWLVLADGLTRAGEDRAAADVLRGALTRRPRDQQLALGYAHALFVLADANVTPAVALAFDRAIALDPAEPSTRFFQALTYLEAGRIGEAERLWRAELASLPAASPWRRVLAERLAIFDAMRGGRPVGQGRNAPAN